MGFTIPAFFLQKRRGDFSEAFLHIDDGAVLIKDQNTGFTGENGY